MAKRSAPSSSSSSSSPSSSSKSSSFPAASDDDECSLTGECPIAVSSSSGSAPHRHALRDMPSWKSFLELFNSRPDLAQMDAMLQLVPTFFNENWMRRLYETTAKGREAERQKDWNQFVGGWAEVALPPGTVDVSLAEARAAVEGATLSKIALQACALYLFPFTHDIEQTKNARELASRVLRAVLFGLEKLAPIAGEGEAALELTPQKSKHARMHRFRVRADEIRVFKAHDDKLVLEGRSQTLHVKRVDPLVERFRFLKVLGSGSYGIAFLAETRTTTWPTGKKRMCVIKAEMTNDEHEMRVMYELTKAYCPERLKNYCVNFVRLFTWSRSLSDILELKNDPQWLPEHEVDTRLAEFLGKHRIMGAAANWTFTAMEYADGGSLSVLVRGAPMSFFRDPRFFRAVMLQVAATLSELRHIGFRHGDLHAANILFAKADPDEPRLEVLEYALPYGKRLQVQTKHCGGRIVKLADFGYATIEQLDFNVAEHNAIARQYDLNLICLSLLGILYDVCAAGAMKLSDVDGNVWATFRRCIPSKFEPEVRHEAVAENAAWLHRYLGHTTEQLLASDPAYQPEASDQRSVFYEVVARRAKHARLNTEMPAGSGEGRGADPDELLSDPFFGQQPRDEEFVRDQRRVTAMNVFDIGYSSLLPLKHRFV